MIPSCLRLRIRSQAEKYLGSLRERLVRKCSIGVFGEVAAYEGIYGLTVLTGVDFNTLILALEELDGGQRFRLESVESQLQALNIIVTSARVLGSAQNAPFENSEGALEVQHFGKLSLTVENLAPAVQIRQGAGESIDKEVVLSCRSGNCRHCVLEQSHDDFVGYQLPSRNELFDGGRSRPSSLTLRAEHVSSG